MRASSDILAVWRAFDAFPMETLTKAWHFRSGNEPKQRSVELMRLHRERYGSSGNCFDLALWLIDAFRREGIPAYAVGHDLLTPNAHVAVAALDERGRAYLCDLGDQWIEPILIDAESGDFTDEPLAGFVSGARVALSVREGWLHVAYLRPNGKRSEQAYDLRPIAPDALLAAGEYSQRLLRKPLVERRIYTEAEVLHWELGDGTSFLSGDRGRTEEAPMRSQADRVERIRLHTGMDRQVIEQALAVYGTVSIEVE
ncbi:hypothetical protein SAMN02799624_00073 [Paenibacillus sp. UNC496MF]|uniref:hypothetical protein n=1 Tax=Paenibacillus sp. UNC496MF TaxID=1502753 RepID=UPI0008F2F388|nr:hypothetical protein [Paenibacillus sp. UNC496MF]SFI27883.1 hypothetical protein SAMN02799624_00073 [Paenibacillus sp. UNC496MF]